MDEMFIRAKKLVQQQGAPSPVHARSSYCQWWEKNHSNCKGCESEVGCVKLTKLMALWSFVNAYPPTSLADYQKIAQNIKILEEKILKTKDLEELRKIPHKPI